MRLAPVPAPAAKRAGNISCSRRCTRAVPLSVDRLGRAGTPIGAENKKQGVCSSSRHPRAAPAPVFCRLAPDLVSRTRLRPSPTGVRRLSGPSTAQGLHNRHTPVYADAVPSPRPLHPAQLRASRRPIGRRTPHLLTSAPSLLAQIWPARRTHCPSAHSSGIPPAGGGDLRAPAETWAHLALAPLSVGASLPASCWSWWTLQTALLCSAVLFCGGSSAGSAGASPLPWSSSTPASPHSTQHHTHHLHHTLLPFPSCPLHPPR